MSDTTAKNQGEAAQAVENVAAVEAAPADAASATDELTRAEERLHAVEAELEEIRARVAELRHDAAPQAEGASAGSQPSDHPTGRHEPPQPPVQSAQSYAAPQGAPQSSSQQPFGAQSYGQPQQPYAAPQQPYGGQPYGAPQQPYGGSQQPYGAPQPQQPFANAPYTPPSYAQPVVTKDHVAAGLLAIFLGVFGVHKFYLGYNTAGFIMLAVTILGSIFTIGLAAGVMWVIALVEGIIYLVKSQSEFDAGYVANTKEWF